MSGENNVQDLSLMLDCFITVYGDNFLLADIFGNFCALLYCMAGGVVAITPCPGELADIPVARSRRHPPFRQKKFPYRFLGKS